MPVFFPRRWGDAPDLSPDGGFRSVFKRQIGGLGNTTSSTIATNSGVQRLRSAAYYREVQRKQGLQVQQIRLAELQQQRQEIEAKRLADEALRKAAETQVGRKAAPVADDGLDERIAALVRELAEVNGAIAQTMAEVARLDAIEAHEALLAEDELIIILAASI